MPGAAADAGSAEDVRSVLQALSLELYYNCYYQDFERMRIRMAPGCRFKLNSHTTLDFDERIRHRRAMGDMYPEFRTVLTGTPTVFEESLGRGRARTFTTFEMHGAPPGVVIEIVTVCDFKWTQGRWLLTCCEDMRSGGDRRIGHQIMPIL